MHDYHSLDIQLIAIYIIFISYIIEHSWQMIRHYMILLICGHYLVMGEQEQYVVTWEHVIEFLLKSFLLNFSYISFFRLSWILLRASHML